MSKFGSSPITADSAPVPGMAKASQHKLFDECPSIDRTYKMYYAGAQKRPDGNYCRPIKGTAVLNALITVVLLDQM